MAVICTTTPFGVTEPASRVFTHTTASRAFSGLLGDLAGYVEAERDISDAAVFDPAFADWVRDAEAARARVLSRIDEIRSAETARPEDRPLKAMAVICGLLIQSNTTAEFLKIRRVLRTAPAQFLCDGSGAVAWRTRQMLRSAVTRIDEMAALPAHVDPWEIDDVTVSRDAVMETHERASAPATPIPA